MSEKRLVWSDKDGDLRKQKNTERPNSSVDEKSLILKVRRLTSGKGRTVIEVKGLPKNKAWCQALAQEIKRTLGLGGTFKEDYIEIHGEKLTAVTGILDAKGLKWKQTGG